VGAVLCCQVFLSLLLVLSVRIEVDILPETGVVGHVACLSCLSCGLAGRLLDHVDHRLSLGWGVDVTGHLHVQQGLFLELVFVVVCYDGDTEVSVLAEQWSSLQLGAHLDLLLTLTLTVSYQSPDC